MVPQKASGGGGGVGGGRVGGGGVVYHTSTGQYIGVATFFFFFFFFLSGLKLDEKSIENGLEGQKFLVVCLFWGGCHHPNHVKYQPVMLDAHTISHRPRQTSESSILPFSSKYAFLNLNNPSKRSQISNSQEPEDSVKLVSSVVEVRYIKYHVTRGLTQTNRDP